jgi:hypothetical protein
MHTFKSALTQTLSNSSTQTSPTSKIPKTDTFDFAPQTTKTTETQTITNTTLEPSTSQTQATMTPSVNFKSSAVQTKPIMESISIQTQPMMCGVHTDTNDLPHSPKYIIQTGMMI